MSHAIYLTQTRFKSRKEFLLLVILAGIAWIGLSLGTGRYKSVSILPSTATLNQFPLAFVPNAGQTETAVRFTASSQPGTLFFSDDGVQLALPAGQVAVAFVGGGGITAVSGTNPLPGVAHYFLGDDPAQWQTDLPTYAAITYQNLYPGIDLVYDGSDGLLKGTYMVAPGANPAQIGWRYEGKTAVTLEPSSGDLHIVLNEATTLIEKAPIAYQMVNGTPQPVSVQYRLAGDTIGFALGDYDPALPLIIDPTLVYSSYLGGNSDDTAKDVAVDGNGNVYVTGSTYSTSFPGGGSGNAGYDDVFVTKINAAETAVLYTTIIGGNGTDEPGGVTVNSSGSKVWLVGQTTSNNLPTVNAFQAASGGGVDAFMMQLNGSGGLAFNSYYGGYLFDAAEDVALDSAGDVHITGSLWGGFFAKIDGQTYDLVYSRMLSGQDATGFGIALDSQANIYITGKIRSSDWPTVNPVQPNCGSYDNWTCSDDAFVVKLTPAGDDLLFSTYLGGSAANGGSGADIGRAIAVDANGNIAVTGETFASDFPVANAAQSQKQGATTMSDAFVTRLVRQGSSYQIGFSTYLGGDHTETGYAVSMNAAGQVLAAGLTNSANFPVAVALQGQLGSGVCFSSSSRNCYDAFVTQFNSDGLRPFSTYWGGTDDDAAYGMALANDGALVVVGSTASGAFPTSGGGFQPSRGQGGEAFVLRLNTGQSPPPPADLPNKVYLPMIVR